MVLNNLWFVRSLLWTSRRLSYFYRSITHDPELFDKPDAFMPERFIDIDGAKPQQPGVRYDDLAFGYGRRICVGRNVAVNSLFITIATLLWAFEFHKALDADGNEITPPAMEFHNTGGTVRSKPFPFKLVARSPRVLEVLQTVS